MPWLKDPSTKYKPFPPVNLPDRQWPSKTITKAPRWLSTDLRDGNQSLVDPMDADQKWRYFELLTKIGYKEIEISFPSASQTDFDFTRKLIETPGTVPDDVWLQVLSPCREDFIKRTVESLKDANKAILHLYLATSECFRRIIFGMSEDQSVELAVKCTKLARSLTKDHPENSKTDWQYEFSPETFSDTSPEFALRICEAVKEAWGPTEERPIIFNLPATVEMSTPNVYADQIEYFSRNISEREKVCISLHPHNDRGCAVAASELGQLAGADRVEGCLFGNGERTGNVDLVTLGLNLYTQGVTPNIDFSDLTEIINVVEDCNKIPVHPRAPYGGQLVVCAFSGSHQDAIKKGFKIRQDKTIPDDRDWEIPYLPLDPADIGRTYEAVIRVNSQSGKGGVAWVILRALDLDLPRGMQVEFSRIVQVEADKLSRELKPKEITAIFEQAYVFNEKRKSRIQLVDYHFSVDRSASPTPGFLGASAVSANTKRTFVGIVNIDGKDYSVRGVGNGPISSLLDALKGLGIDLDVVDYKEHAIGKGKDVKAATYINLKQSDPEVEDAKAKAGVWGLGVHEDTAQASLLSALNAASALLPDNFKPRSRTITENDTVEIETVKIDLNCLEEAAENI